MGHPLTREKLVLFVLTVLFSPLAVAAVILRTVVVRKVHKYNQPWGIDDWLLYVALCFLVGLCITASFMYWTIDMSQPNEFTGQGDQSFNKAFYFAQVLYHVCMAAAKLSILYTYIRIFAGRVSNKWFKRTVQTIQAILLLYSLIILVVTIAQCIPVSYAFDWTKHGECMNRNMLFTAVIVTNIITDTAILTILIAVVMSLKISLRKRCVLYGTMMIGCLGLAVAMARLITSYISYDDHISEILLLTFFMAIEPAVVIIGACLPFLKPLFSAMALSVETQITLKSRFRNGLHGLCCFQRSHERDEQDNLGLDFVDTSRRLEAARETSGHYLWTHSADRPRAVDGDMSCYKSPQRPTNRLEKALLSMDSPVEFAAQSPLFTGDPSPPSQHSSISALAADLNKPLPPRPLAVALAHSLAERAGVRRAAARDGGTDKVLVAVNWPQPASKHVSEQSMVEYLRPTCYGQTAADELYKPLKLPRSYGLPQT